jgi:hypothetical protein
VRESLLLNLFIAFISFCVVASVLHFFLSERRTKDKLEVFRMELRCFIQWNKLICNGFVNCSKIFEYSKGRIIDSHYFVKICSVASSKIQILGNDADSHAQREFLPPVQPHLSQLGVPHTQNFEILKFL